MTYYFTPFQPITEYRTSLGHRYDVNKEQVYFGSAFLAVQPDNISDTRILDVTGYNGRFAGRYNDEDVVALWVKEIPTVLYRAGWDKSASYWGSLFRENMDTIPILYASVTDDCIPFIIDTDQCKYVVSQLQNCIRVSDMNAKGLELPTALNVMLEVFSLAVSHNGFVRLC